MDRTGRGATKTHLTVEEVLADPATSYWLRDALTNALDRDPGDAALDGLILSDLLLDRFDAIVKQAKQEAI